MKSQVIINEKDIRIITADGFYEAVIAVLIHKRRFLVDKVQIDVVYAHVHAMVTETPIHVIAEVTSLLPHVTVGMQNHNSMVRILADAGVHAATGK